MVFVGDGGAEQRHNAIAEHLVDRTLEAVYGVHHPMDGRVQELRAASGSRPRMNSVEPLRSAKSTVTCLRSPVRVGRAARIFSVRCAGV